MRSNAWSRSDAQIMIYEFRLPDIGEGVVEGEVVRWLVQEGDLVREDQPLVEIMTDKATVEIPAPRAGRVSKRMFEEGQICPVGRVLIAIDTDADAAADGVPTGSTPAAVGGAKSGAPAGSQAHSTHGPAASPTTEVVTAAGARSANGAVSGVRVLATPATRRLARELGVDIRQVLGSGRSGRVTSDDVRERGRAEQSAFSPNPPATTTTTTTKTTPGVVAARSSRAPAADVRIPFRGVRKKIAERLVHSKHTAAHFTYVEEIDCSDLVALREQANQRLAERGVKLSFLPFIVKATVAALLRYPQLNSTLDEEAGEIVQHAGRHIGLATATDQGLIVPVIRDAADRSLVGLAQEIQRLSDLTRTGKATRAELSGSTFTITSLGALGGLLATPIINFPEAAILGVHKIAKRPMADGKRVVVRDMMNLSISVDHRIVDGYEAAQFVAEIKATLENPGLMFLDSI